MSQLIQDAVCPILPKMDASNLTKAQITAYLNTPEVIMLFDKKCGRGENESGNKWREKLVLKIFNMKPEDPLLANGYMAPLWQHYYRQLKALENDMLVYEGILEINGL